MRTKTNFQAVQELMARYAPAQRMVVSDAEAALIREVLELDGRDGLELDDIRDTAVAVYGQSAAQAEKDLGLQAMMDMMDAMSAVTAVIDQEKAARQLPGQAVAKYPVEPRYAVARNGNSEFLRATAKPAFSADPSQARKWVQPQDAGVMAGYAARQYGAPMSVVRIETCRTVFPVRDLAAEQAKFRNGAGGAGNGGTDDES